MLARDVAVLADIGVGDVIFLLKRADHVDKRIELRLRHVLLVKIAHQADVDVVRPVGLDLAYPAETHFDLAVAGCRAVADHKMVKQSAHSAVTVIIVKAAGAALERAAVMHGDRPPVGVIVFGADDAKRIFRAHGTRARPRRRRLAIALLRNKKFLPDHKPGNIVDIVSHHDLVDAHMVKLGDVINRLPFFKSMIKTLRRLNGTGRSEICPGGAHGRTRTAGEKEKVRQDEKNKEECLFLKLLISVQN